MSALISELCERDVPEIDWEKLGETNSSVFDIYHWTGESWEWDSSKMHV